MNGRDRFLGVMAIVLFIVLVAGFSHYAEKASGDDEKLRVKAEKALKQLRYREAHGYLVEMLEKGEANLTDKGNILLCLEKLREWKKLGPQIDELISSEKDPFNKGMLHAFKVKNLARESYWSNKAKIFEAYANAHKLIEERPLSQAQKTLFEEFLLDEIRLHTSHGNESELKMVEGLCEKLEKLGASKSKMADGWFLEAEFFANNSYQVENRYSEIKARYTRIFTEFPKAYSARKAQLNLGRYLLNSDDFLGAIDQFDDIGKKWRGTDEAIEAVKLKTKIISPHINLSVARVFRSGEKGEFLLQTRNQREIELSVYKIELISNFLETKDLQKLVNLYKPGEEKPVATWKHNFKGEEDHSWQDSMLKLPTTESGAYIVLAQGEKVANRTLFLISDLANAMKSHEREVSVYAANAITGEPVAGAELVLASIENDDEQRNRYESRPFDVFTEGKTDSSGIWENTSNKQFRSYSPTLLIVRNGDDYALSGASIYYRHLTERVKETFLYVYTDRAVYRPGQKVNFKAIVRLKDDKGYSLPTTQDVTVTLAEPSGSEKKVIKLKLNEFGTISGSFQLGEEAALGNWNINVIPQNGHGYARFRVEEYKKPEYEVAVDMGKSQYHLGEKISAAVSAKFFYGEPVKGAEVTYTVYRSSRYWYFQSPDSWDWFYGSSHRRGYYGRSRNMVHQGTGKLNEKGILKLDIPTSKMENDGRETIVYDYTIAATVRDASRRNIDGSGQTIVSSHDFNVHARTDKYIYPVNAKATVKIYTQRYDGSKIATQGELVIYTAKWDRGKNDYDLTKISQISASTDNSGEGEAVLTLPNEGSYYLQYETADKYDNVIHSRSSIYVSSANFRGKLEGSSGLEILADKDVYFSGDTAKLMIRSSLKKSWAWITLEADKVLESRVVPVETGMNIIDIPINSTHQPNVFVKVLLFSDYQVYRKQLQLKVPPVEKFAEVTLIPDKAEYKPGEKGKYSVVVKDHKGNPVQAEFSIGVVDASLDYFGADTTPDMRKHFYGRTRYDNVNTSGSWQFRFHSGRNEIVEGGLVAQKAVAPGMAFAAEESNDEREMSKAGGIKKEKKAAQIRKDFKDSALWLAQVTTDANGRAVAEITWPENLTRWRAVARAISKDSLVGSGMVNVVTRKNLLVRLQTPRFMVQGDQVTISLNVHNYLKTAKSATIEFKAEGVKFVSPTTKVVQIAAGGEARVDVVVQALVPGEAKITGVALTDEESDGMQITLPVLIHGMEKFEGGAGSVTEDKTVELTLPEKIREGSASLRISVNPTVARTMLESLPYLVKYPYGCVEQTMSRFLPAAVVAKALQDMGYDQPELHEKLPDILKKGLNRLYDFQHSDGGWGWWKNDSSSPYMSAYVVYGLTLAKDIGVNVNGSVLQRGRTFLQSQLESIADEVETLNFVLFALSGGGKIDEKFFNRIEDLLPRMKEYETALFAVTLANQKQTQRFKKVVQRLADLAKKNEKYGTASWGEPGGYYWYQDNVEATSLALMALMKQDPHSDLVKGAVRWLMSNRKGGKWKSTRDTAFAIFALSDYMKATGELDPNSQVEVFLNGKSIRKITFTKDNVLSDAGEILIGADQLKSGKQSIRIVSSGKGNVYYDVFLKYFSLEEPITAASTTISVDRKYFKIRETLDEKGEKEVHRTEVKEGDVLTSGETIEAQLILKSDNIYEYLVYEDFKPAGCEPVDRTSGNRWGSLVANMELRDEKVAFFIGHLPVGESKISYRLRVEIPGKFHALPVNGYAMYAPDVRAISDEFIMEIKDK